MFNFRARMDDENVLTFIKFPNLNYGIIFATFFRYSSESSDEDEDIVKTTKKRGRKRKISSGKQDETNSPVRLACNGFC